MELHRETPQEGLSMQEKFGANVDVEGMVANLRRAGAPYGIEFAPVRRLSNSRMALELGELAREQGKFHEYHEAVFHAYFTEGRDIGDLNVLHEVAEKVGLDVEKWKEALDEGRYMPRLEQTLEEAARYGITGTPTFIINDKYAIVGAQPLERVRQALIQIAADE